MAPILAELKSFASTLFHSSATPASHSVTCSVDGAPPMRTVEPVTFRPRRHASRAQQQAPRPL
jgi:hypothetical protein